MVQPRTPQFPTESKDTQPQDNPNVVGSTSNVSSSGTTGFSPPRSPITTGDSGFFNSGDREETRNYSRPLLSSSPLHHVGAVGGSGRGQGHGRTPSSTSTSTTRPLPNIPLQSQSQSQSRARSPEEILHSQGGRGSGLGTRIIDDRDPEDTAAFVTLPGHHLTSPSLLSPNVTIQSQSARLHGGYDATSAIGSAGGALGFANGGTRTSATGIGSGVGVGERHSYYSEDGTIGSDSLYASAHSTPLHIPGEFPMDSSSGASESGQERGEETEEDFEARARRRTDDTIRLRYQPPAYPRSPIISEPEREHERERESEHGPQQLESEGGSRGEPERRATIAIGALGQSLEGRLGGIDADNELPRRTPKRAITFDYAQIPSQTQTQTHLGSPMLHESNQPRVGTSESSHVDSNELALEYYGDAIAPYLRQLAEEENDAAQRHQQENPAFPEPLSQPHSHSHPFVFGLPLQEHAPAFPESDHHSPSFPHPQDHTQTSNSGATPTFPSQHAHSYTPLPIQIPTPTHGGSSERVIGEMEIPSTGTSTSPPSGPHVIPNTNLEYEHLVLPSPHDREREREHEHEHREDEEEHIKSSRPLPSFPNPSSDVGVGIGSSIPIRSRELPDLPPIPSPMIFRPSATPPPPTPIGSTSYPTSTSQPPPEMLMASPSVSMPQANIHFASSPGSTSIPLPGTNPSPSGTGTAPLRITKHHPQTQTQTPTASGSHGDTKTPPSTSPSSSKTHLPLPPPPPPPAPIKPNETEAESGRGRERHNSRSRVSSIPRPSRLEPQSQSQSQVPTSTSAPTSTPTSTTTTPSNSPKSRIKPIPVTSEHSGVAGHGQGKLRPLRVSNVSASDVTVISSGVGTGSSVGNVSSPRPLKPALKKSSVNYSPQISGIGTGTGNGTGRSTASGGTGTGRVVSGAAHGAGVSTSNGNDDGNGLVRKRTQSNNTNANTEDHSRPQIDTSTPTSTTTATETKPKPLPFHAIIDDRPQYKPPPTSVTTNNNTNANASPSTSTTKATPTSTNTNTSPSQPSQRQQLDHEPKTLTEAKAQYNSIPASSRSQYMNMLLALDDIPSYYNIFASFFTWILLAGFVILPGTFTSLQNLDLGGGGGGGNTGLQGLVDSVTNIPLFVVGFVCTGIGITGMGYCWWRWMKNYIWLTSKIFLPGLMNSLAGIISTIVNVYGVQHGEFNTTSIVTISVTGGICVLCTLLALVYEVFLLGQVKKRHRREMGIEKAGKHGEGVWAGFKDKLNRR